MKQVADNACLSVGTKVSAKYKRAFFEAKVQKIVRNLKCKVTYEQGLGSGTVSDNLISGVLRVGASVTVNHPKKRALVTATITNIQDCSQYTVVFDDGDIKTLRRKALTLRSGQHFSESETLNHFSLTHPDHFAQPVIGSRRGHRSRQLHDDSSAADDDDNSKEIVNDKKEHIGKVVCVKATETEKKDKEKWFPGLVVSPTAQVNVRVRVKHEYLVRSFKDDRYYTVPKKEALEFTKEMGPALQAALEYLDNKKLPPHWVRDALFGLTNSSSGYEGEIDSDSSDGEPQEEKDNFIAQRGIFIKEECDSQPIEIAKSVIKEEPNPSPITLIQSLSNSSNRKKNKYVKKKEQNLGKSRSRKRKEAGTDSEKSGDKTFSDATFTIPEFPVDIGDKLLIYYNEKTFTYESKVIGISMQQGTPLYLVHYIGWNSRYDEWVPRERIANNLTAGASRTNQGNQPPNDGSKGGLFHNGKNNSNVSSTDPGPKGIVGAKRGRGRSKSHPSRSSIPFPMISNLGRTKPSAAQTIQRRITRGQPSKPRGVSINILDISMQTDEPVKKRTRSNSASTFSQSGSNSNDNENIKSTVTRASSQNSQSETDEKVFDAPKDIDHDLNRIRSQFKGFEEVKSPSPELEEPQSKVTNQEKNPSNVLHFSTTGEIDNKAIGSTIEKSSPPIAESKASTDVSSETDANFDLRPLQIDKTSTVLETPEITYCISEPLKIQVPAVIKKDIDLLLNKPILSFPGRKLDTLETIAPKNNNLSEILRKLKSSIQKTTYNVDSSDSTDSERLVIHDDSQSSDNNQSENIIDFSETSKNIANIKNKILGKTNSAIAEDESYIFGPSKFQQSIFCSKLNNYDVEPIVDDLPPSEKEHTSDMKTESVISHGMSASILHSNESIKDDDNSNLHSQLINVLYDETMPRSKTPSNEMHYIKLNFHPIELDLTPVPMDIECA